MQIVHCLRKRPQGKKKNAGVLIAQPNEFNIAFFMFSALQYCPVASEVITLKPFRLSCLYEDGMHANELRYGSIWLPLKHGYSALSELFGLSANCTTTVTSTLGHPGRFFFCWIRNRLLTSEKAW